MTTPRTLLSAEIEAIVASLRGLAVDTGVSTDQIGVGSNTLTDSTKSWQADIHKNRIVRITSGLGVGQAAKIVGNLASILLIQGSWARIIAPGDTYVILDLDVAQVLKDTFGGGANISLANPLIVDASPYLRRVISSNDLLIGAGWNGFSANALYNGFNGSGKVDADKTWVNVDDSATYGLLARIEKKLGEFASQVYSRPVFLYPEGRWRAVFTTLAATPGNNHYLGFENGGSSPKGLAIFAHNYSGGADHIYAYCCSGGGVDITALVATVAPDWLTAPHWYEIKINPLSVDFFIKQTLVCTYTIDKDIPAAVSQLGAYRSLIIPNEPTSGQSQSPIMSEFIAIEGATTEGPVYFPVSKYFHTVVEADPDRKPRLYLLASIAILAAQGITDMADCLPLHGGSQYALTIALTYAAGATQGARVHVKTSYDGTTYDTAWGGPVAALSHGDLDTWDMDFYPDTPFRQTKYYDSLAKFTKFRIENLDAVQAITNISIRVQVKG